MPPKVWIVKTRVFPAVMHGCESLNIKKAEHHRIDAFELVLEKTLESPLDCKDIQPFNSKGNQSWIFIGRTDIEGEAPILWPLNAKIWLIGKDPDNWERLRVGDKGGNIRWDGWMASLTQWTWVWMSSGRWRRIGEPGKLQSMGVTKSWTQLIDWTTTKTINFNWRMRCSDPGGDRNVESCMNWSVVKEALDMFSKLYAVE